MTFDTAKAFESKKKRTYDDLKTLARSAVSNGRQEDFSISDNFDTATYYGATRLKDRVNDLQKKINSGNSEIIDYLKSAKWSDDSDYKYYNDRVKSLSSETNDFVNALKKNKGLYNELYGESSINELVQSFDSAKSNFSELLSKIENKKNIFSKWKSEDEYKAFTNTQKYKDYSYDDIQKEIASKQKNGADEKEVNWLKNFAVSKNYATVDDYNKGISETKNILKLLDKERDEILLRMNGFRRGHLQYTDQYKNDEKRLAEISEEIKKTNKNRDALESGKELKRRDDIIQGEMSVQNNADFSDVSANRELNNPSRDELKKYDMRIDTGTWYTDGTGDYYNSLGEKIGKDTGEYLESHKNNGINDKLGLYLSAYNSEYDLKEAAALAGYNDTWADTVTEGVNGYWQELSENEKAVYYYYLNKGERDKAYKFLDDMGYQLGLRANEKEKAELEGANALLLIAANAASVPANVFGGIAAFVSDTANVISGKDVNPYDKAHSAVNSAQNVRDETAQRIADSIDNDVISALVSNGYQAVMSGADSLLGAATLGSGYTVAMGMGAASQKAKELYENGASRGQIALGSLASGAIEWITEKFSYDFIVDKLWNNPKSGRALIKAVLASAANEGVEEVNSDILNMVSDAIIQGGNSVSERDVRELINSTGVSEEEARNTVAAQNAINTFWSFYGGFISGGLMSGGGLALNLGQNALMDAAYAAEYKKQSGENIVEGDNVNALVEVARGLDDTKANNKLKALAEQIAATDTEKLSARQQAAFSNKVGKLYSEVQKAQATAHSESTGNAVRMVIEEKVKEKGVSDESDVKTATDAIFKTVYDERKLSSSEDRLLKKYDLDGIATELLNDEENVMSHAIKAENETRGAYFETAKLADTDNSSARNVDTSDYDISDDGKTYRSDTGKEVKITGISTIKNGKMTVNLSDGSSTSLNNISLGSSGDAILYEGVLQMGVSAGAAQMIVKSYSPALGMTPLNYIRGVQDAVKYGKIGSKSFLNSGVFSGALPEQIRNSMYRVGEIEAERAAQKKAKAKEKYARKNTNVKNNNGNVSFRGIDRNSLNERQKVSVNAVEAVFGEMGINVVFFQSETNENGVHIGKNGSYDPETNTIELDISAGVQGKDTVLFTAAHELTHFIAEWSPDKFKAFANFLVKNYEQKGINVNQIVEERMQTAEANGREFDYDTAFEEVIADSCESFLRDSHLADRLVELAKADMTLFEKIKSYIKGLLEKVIKAYAGLLPDSKEGRFVLEMKESLEQLHDMWEKAALDARGNYRSVNGIALANKNTADKSEVKHSDRNKILPGMADSERAELLNNTVIKLAEYDGKNDDLNGKNVLLLKSSYNSQAGKILKSLGEKFGVFKTYNNQNVSLDFDYSRSSLNESVHKQGDISTDFYDFAKMLYVFDEVVENAVPIEVHTDKYKGTSRENTNLKYDYVLLSAFRDDNYIVPVEFHLKEMRTDSGQDNKLYVSVTLGKIKMEDKVKVAVSDENHQTKDTNLSSTISIPDLISKVNPEYGDFYKYFPESILSKQQNNSRSIAVNDENYRLKVMRGEDVTDILERKAKENGYIKDESWKMDHKAPNSQDGYSNSMDNIDKSYGSDGSIYSQQAVYYYGEGREYDNKAISIIRSAKNNPDKMIKIYRAVPKDIKDMRVRNGDWVAIVKEYAIEHGSRVLDDNFRIIENTVPAKQLFNNGDSINEWGYDNGNKNEVYKNTAANVKLNEITYDDSGNLIPLSRRFDESNKDKRFSERDPVAAEAYAEINKQLEREKAEMSEDLSRAKELVRLQNKLTHGTVFTDSSMDVAARTLMSYVNAKGEKSEFKGLLNDFYSYIAKGEDLSWESVKEKAEPVINWLRDHEYHKAQRSEFANSVLKDLRTKRIALNDNQKQEAADLYGSYEEFRKRNMGRIIITDSGVSLDTQWAELAKAYPTLFDESITSAEQPVELMSIIEGLQNNDVNEYFFSNEMAEQDLFSKVYDTYWNVSTLHTVKDRMQTEINKLKAKHNEKIREMRYNHTKKDNELKQRYAERTAELRKYYKEREAQIAKNASERYQKSREGIAKTQMRGSIKKVITDLNGLLNQSTKKRNVKEGLKDTVSAALYSAKMLFSPAITNEDIIRNGVKNATAKEMRLIAEYTDLLNKRDDYSERIRTLGDMTASKQRNDTIAGLQNMIDYVNRKIAPINKELHSLFERERNGLYKAPVSVAINALANAYSALKSSETAYIRNVYDDFVYNRIVALKDSLDGALIKDMNMSQLTELRDAYKMVLHTVREANKLFGEEKKATVTETADKVAAEIRQVGGSKEKQLVLTSFLKKQSWKFLKPVYAFRTIGSDTMTDLYNDIRNGEDVWKRMVDKAIAVYRDAGKEYNSSRWDNEKTYAFKSRSGKEFSLSLQQIMEIYGYSKRDQAMKHLVQGGFVFDNSVIVKEKSKVLKAPLKYEVNVADAYGLNEEIIGQIVDTLTPEQKSYVDELQAYLTKLGEEGNKVSMELYGIKLFKEQNYLPIKSAEWYSNFRPDSTNEFSMRNSAFTKETNQFANNPILLSNFADVFGQHVNDMAMYCSFVLPLENFMKVFNYHTAATAESDARSVRGALKNAYGDGAEAYIRQLLRDLNGGVRAQSGAEIVNKLTGLAKKGAVFASASVTVQQISAIPRAMAYINAKYFATTANKSFNLKRHKSDWEEMKKWAPIAGIKEMGYFDTGLGRSTVNYITAEEYEGLKDKFGAFFKDSDFRDEILSKGPAFIDEIGWVSIWNAVKRETADKTDLEVNSTEFMEKCAKRFTEVITLTQVYDSVFSRSELMRSKDAGTKMATAFMAEPTTVLNMVFDAALQAKRTGNFKFLGKALGAVGASILLNELLKALVTAGRNDDDDKTWLEKYLSEVRGGVLDNLNPLTYIPWAKDVASLFAGYNIDRMDMAVFADFADAYNRLLNSDERKAEDWIDLVNSIAAFAGIPAKNIYRDIKSAVNTFNDIFLNDNENSAYGIEQALKGGSGYKNKAEIAFKHNDTDSVSNIVSQVEGKKVRDGKTEKQAKASVRSSFTATYKKKYLKAYKKGNIKEQNRIRSFLYATGLYGSLSELDAIIAKWIENSED